MAAWEVQPDLRTIPGLCVGHYLDRPPPKPAGLGGNAIGRVARGCGNRRCQSRAGVETAAFDRVDDNIARRTLEHAGEADRDRKPK